MNKPRQLLVSLLYEVQNSPSRPVSPHQENVPCRMYNLGRTIRFLTIPTRETEEGTEAKPK